MTPPVLPLCAQLIRSSHVALLVPLAAGRPTRSLASHHACAALMRLVYCAALCPCPGFAGARAGAGAGAGAGARTTTGFGAEAEHQNTSTPDPPPEPEPEPEPDSLLQNCTPVLVDQTLIRENDQSVQTSVETISTTGVAGYTTYTITLHLQSNALNCYWIGGGSDFYFPPAYQVSAPFGSDVGGVSPALFGLNPLAQYDSWITVGETSGNTGNKVSSIGIDFSLWTEQMPLRSAADTGGGVIWLDPDQATAAVDVRRSWLSTTIYNDRRTMVVAQLTLQDVVSQVRSQVVFFAAQGRSVGQILGVGDVLKDWQENCIEVFVGGPQNGQGSHPVMPSTTGSTGTVSSPLASSSELRRGTNKPAVPSCYCRQSHRPRRFDRRRRRRRPHHPRHPDHI